MRFNTKVLNTTTLSRPRSVSLMVAIRVKQHISFHHRTEQSHYVWYIWCEFWLVLSTGNFSLTPHEPCGLDWLFDNCFVEIGSSSHGGACHESVIGMASLRWTYATDWYWPYPAFIVWACVIDTSLATIHLIWIAHSRDVLDSTVYTAWP